ncbi:helix-turn-helix transcriptional regulator [Pseudonocardia nematodicida]|uniref:Helix-turn-helix transcriptional regulator n=1 Tax=Pseudonocardia nematodicida TaxID=1206997 RepID=A0ABV1K8Y4_9PSEU
MAELEPRNFLKPCLLLLLREHDDHGYGLAGRLHPWHDDGDAGSVYRALRGLEKCGLVRSEWHASAVGPARRTYHLTVAGREHLDGQVLHLAEVCASLQEFLDRYAALDGADRVDVGEVSRAAVHRTAVPGQRRGAP